MAWTTPKTWATEPLTSTDMNTHIRDNLNALKAPPTDTHKIDNATNYTTALTGWRDVDATDFNVSITTTGGDVLIGGYFVMFNASNLVSWDIEVDGVRWGGDDGIGFAPSSTYAHICPNILVTGLSSGVHTFKLVWNAAGGTSTLYAVDYHGQFWAREI